MNTNILWHQAKVTRQMREQRNRHKSFISPFRSGRDSVRASMGAGDFIEVYCQAPLSVCEQRDVKGLYSKARLGEISEFTGISSPYEAPENPEIVVMTGECDVAEGTRQIIQYLEQNDKIALSD